MTEQKLNINVGDSVRWVKKAGFNKWYPSEDGSVISIINGVYNCRTSKGQTWKIKPLEEGGNDRLTKREA